MPQSKMHSSQDTSGAGAQKKREKATTTVLVCNPLSHMTIYTYMYNVHVHVSVHTRGSLGDSLSVSMCV